MAKSRQDNIGVLKSLYNEAKALIRDRQVYRPICPIWEEEKKVSKQKYEPIQIMEEEVRISKPEYEVEYEPIQVVGTEEKTIPKQKYEPIQVLKEEITTPTDEDILADIEMFKKLLNKDKK